MAEPEVATRAPENDAAEPGIIPSNTPSLGEHCVTDKPTSIGSAPSGEIVKICDIDVYISKPNDYPHQSSKLLLFLTGGTGLHSKNNQLQADKFASEGFLVVMPDMFDGDQAPNSSTTIEDMNPTIIEQIKLRAAVVAKSFMLDMWLARHTPEKIIPILYKILEGTKEEFADAVANGNGIYCVGYCLGAKYCLQLASEREELSLDSQKHADEEAGLIRNGPHIRAGAIAHGTLVTAEDFRGLKSPMMLICVENDQLFPQEILDQGQRYMEKNHIPHEIKIFPSVPHGFAITGDYDDPNIELAQEQAFNDMLSWLKAH